MSGTLNPLSSPYGQLAQAQSGSLSPIAYNASLFPQGLYRNSSGAYATPYSQSWTGGNGWTNVLTPDATTGKTGDLPAWAGAANPLQATQMWGQQQNQSVYGTSDPTMLGVLGSAGFPMWSDPRLQQDFAAQTFGMTPQTWMQQTYGTPQYPVGGTG